MQTASNLALLRAEERVPALPEYAARLDALHCALVTDFQRIVSTVDWRDGASVLDAGCGDGFFSNLLARHASYVIGVDTSRAFLREAARNLAVSPAGSIELTPGDVRALPTETASVDLVWSGHSMQSYPDHAKCLSEFRRVLRPGGTLAILETDNVHSIMLSWPPDIELAVRQAEHREIVNDDSYRGTYFPRFAEELLTEAGYVNYRTENFLIERHGPANRALTRFAQLYLENLIQKTGDSLSEGTRGRLELLADPQHDSFLPRQSTFQFKSLQVLIQCDTPCAIS